MIYLVRVMKVLMNHDEITVTNLAMLSQTNHQRCQRLVKQLHGAGYMVPRVNGRKQYFALAAKGRDFGNRLLEVNTLCAIAGGENSIISQL